MEKLLATFSKKLLQKTLIRFGLPILHISQRMKGGCTLRLVSILTGQAQYFLLNNVVL
ncbi:hypothetical protein SAMN05660649_05147 [Desulfotomaculum arcticum]|uniref:Uncharacterized protein n=1 Tax=Desulfotruncus arcticus DSM 17038 TaxID=1121424 RepID=A0A1I2ZXK3_9FIRM|nr:hypothetical protein SAMN05660649_05147 [Desulfotomaculum arcticum] [Desulfotruncus arcticus DSM 17038]